MSSPLCSKQNQLQRVLQSHEYLQDRRLKNLSGQPVLILDQSEHKKLFLVFRWNFLYFHLWPFPLILSRGTTKKSLVLSSLHSLLRGAPELSLLQARRTSSLSLILYERWSNLSITLESLCWMCYSASMYILYWGAQHWRQHPGVLISY